MARKWASFVLKDLQSEDAEDALQVALKAIASLLYAMDRYAQQDLYQLGGHALVVQVMNKHPECLAIQANGTEVLKNTSDGDYTEVGMRSAIVRVGGFQSIVAAMKHSEAQNGVIRDGLLAFYNLIAHFEPNAKVFVADTDCIPLVLECMEKYQDDKDVMIHACELLNHLAGFESLRKSLVDANVGSSLMAAYEHYKDTTLCYICCSIRVTAGTAIKMLL